MKAESSAAYLKDFFVRSFENLLHVTGLPLAEVKLLEEEWEELSPEIFALAMAHAYERALAIQKGMKVLGVGLDKGAFHLHTDSTCVWFVPQHASLGHDHRCATYGSTDWEARMTYVLTHMPLPIPMDAWMREYR